MFWNLVTVKVSTGSLSEILGPDVFKSGVFFFWFQNIYTVMIANIPSRIWESDL